MRPPAPPVVRPCRCLRLLCQQGSWSQRACTLPVPPPSLLHHLFIFLPHCLHYTLHSQIRKLMIDMVLATDMAIHFELINRFKAEMEAKPDVAEWTERSLLFQMAVHLADIANPSRPFHLARGWAERVIEEFCDQVRCGLGGGADGGGPAGWDGMVRR